MLTHAFSLCVPICFLYCRSLPALAVSCWFLLPKDWRTPLLILPVSFIFQIFCNCCKKASPSAGLSAATSKRRAFHWGSVTGIRYSQKCLDLPWNIPPAVIRETTTVVLDDGFPKPCDHSAAVDRNVRWK